MKIVNQGAVESNCNTLWVVSKIYKYIKNSILHIPKGMNWLFQNIAAQQQIK